MVKAYYTAITSTPTVVHDGPCVIYGVSLTRSAAAELIVYNHASGTTNPVFELRTTGESPADRANIPSDGYFFSNGCYVTMSAGTGKVMWYPA